jgi:hypothetical protein
LLDHPPDCRALPYPGFAHLLSLCTLIFYVYRRFGQDKHIRELRDTFHKFDAENKGHLSVRELGA